MFILSFCSYSRSNKLIYTVKKLVKDKHAQIRSSAALLIMDYEIQLRS